MNARHLFIVSRAHPTVFDYLREQFSPEADVNIILDRRRDQRRRAGETPGLERRCTDRRTRPHVEAELRSTSHVFLPAAVPSTGGRPGAQFAR